MKYSRIIHCEGTGKYRVQVWRIYWPLWDNVTCEGWPVEFDSEVDARQFLYEENLVAGQWRVLVEK